MRTNQTIPEGLFHENEHCIIILILRHCLKIRNPTRKMAFHLRKRVRRAMGGYSAIRKIGYIEYNHIFIFKKPSDGIGSLG